MLFNDSCEIIYSVINVSDIEQYKMLKHTTTLFVLSDHYIQSREWGVIVDQVQTNYHGRLMVPYSVRCDRAVDYKISSLFTDVF